MPATTGPAQNIDREGQDQTRGKLPTFRSNAGLERFRSLVEATVTKLASGSVEISLLYDVSLFVLFVLVSK